MIGLEHLHPRPGTELVLEQPRGLRGDVHLLRPGLGDETGDHHAAERAHVQLGLEGSLDRNLHEARAPRDGKGGERETKAEAEARLLLLGLAISLVIGFSEQVEVLLDVDAAGLQLQSLLVGLAGLVEIALLLEGYGKIVERFRVVGIGGDGLLEAKSRFLPEAFPGHVDPEFHLLPAAGCGLAVGSGGEKKPEERYQHQDTSSVNRNVPMVTAPRKQKQGRCHAAPSRIPRAALPR